MPHSLPSTELVCSPAVNACGDGGQHVLQVGEEPVVRDQVAGPTSRRARSGPAADCTAGKQQAEHGAICSQHGFEQNP